MTATNEQALRQAVQAMMLRNVCLTNTNVPDSVEVPLLATMGELRALSAALASDTGERGVVPPVDCMGLALDLEQQAERGVASQTAERAMRAAATGLRRIAALRAQPAGGGVPHVG